MEGDALTGTLGSVTHHIMLVTNIMFFKRGVGSAYIQLKAINRVSKGEQRNLSPQIERLARYPPLGMHLNPPQMESWAVLLEMVRGNARCWLGDGTVLLGVLSFIFP